jgi:hypothetical protein
MSTVREAVIVHKLIGRRLFYYEDTMSAPHTVTSLQNAPERERRVRMIKYTAAMGIRLACIGACFLVSGWWLLIPALGAIVLPYVAVVVANSATKDGQQVTPLRPGTVSVTSQQ